MSVYVCMFMCVGLWYARHVCLVVLLSGMYVWVYIFNMCIYARKGFCVFRVGVSMYVCMSMCVCMAFGLPVSVCMYVWLSHYLCIPHAYMDMCVCMYVCMHVCIVYVFMPVCMRVCLYVCM